MAKQLELTVTLKGSQASTALKQLKGQMEDMNKEQRKLKEGADTAGNSMSNLGSKITRSFSTNVTSALSKTGEQLMTMTKYALAAGVAFGGIFAGRAVQNMLSFSKEFTLLNATLRAQSSQAQNTVKQSLFSISNDTGKSVEEITKAMTQLYSSGLKPKSKERLGDGTINPAYISELKQVEQIQRKLALSAMATGEDTVEMGNAFVYAAKSMSKDVSSISDMNEIMDLFAGTLDEGIGVMSDYSNQFVKFGIDAQNAGFKSKESLGIFAQLTKTMNPEMAGFSTSALMRYFNNAPQEIQQGQRNIRMALKGGGFSKEETNFLGKLLTNEGRDKMFYKVMPNGSRMKRNGMEVLDSIAEAMKSLPKNSKVADVLLKSFGGDVATKKALQNLGASFDLTSLKDTIDKVGQQGIMDAKIATMSGGFATKWNMMSQRIRNTITVGTDTIAPALGLFMDMLVGGVSGKGFSTSGADGAFALVRENIKQLGPEFEGIKGPLTTITAKIEQFYKYATSSEGRKLFDSVLKGAMGVARTMASIGESVAKLLGNPAVQQVLAMMAEHPVLAVAGLTFGGNLLGGLTTSIAGAAASGLMSSGVSVAVNGIATKLATSMGLAVGSIGFGSVAVLAAATGLAVYFGGKLADSIRNAMDKAGQEVSSQGSENRRLIDLAGRKKNGTITNEENNELNNLMTNKNKATAFNSTLENQLDRTTMDAIAELMGKKSWKNFTSPQKFNAIKDDLNLSPGELAKKYGERNAMQIYGLADAGIASHQGLARGAAGVENFNTIQGKKAVAQALVRANQGGGMSNAFMSPMNPNTPGYNMQSKESQIVRAVEKQNQNSTNLLQQIAGGIAQLIDVTRGVSLNVTSQMQSSMPSAKPNGPSGGIGGISTIPRIIKFGF